MQRVLTTVTLLGLLVLTAAAFVITQHLKSIKSPIFGTKVTNLDDVPTKLFSPVCGARCPDRAARLTIRLRHRDHATVTIVDAAGHTVATIGSPDKTLAARTPHLFTWDGREADGSLAPDGVYHPWVALSHARHTYRFTNKITIDTVPPKVVSAGLAHPTLFAGGGHTVTIHYGFSEPAHPIVYLGRRPIIVGRHSRQTPSAKVQWAGTENGRPLPAGAYVLAIGGQDLAGNETPPAQRKHVRVVIRYVQLSPAHVSVRGGSRLHVRVRTAASRYTWRLGKRHGSHRGRILHVRAPTTPGTYRLVVRVEGQAATAVVRVRG